MTMSEQDFIDKAVELGFTHSANAVTGTQLRLKKFDERRLKELAILVMKASVNEVRDDKVPPAVGAVIYLPDGSVGTAYRGELRDGDHGEYTLLERKLGSQRLDEGILFTTLEPCMERNPPKVCCARRITLARIKTVYVGIQDPDLTVDGDGIEYLESKGVEVRMFDRELQEEIERVNEKFLANANDRKREVEEELPPSLLETTASNVDWQSFSDEALAQFCDVAQIPESTDSPEFRQRLARLKVLDESGEPTNNGIILFGQEPRETIVESGVLGTIHYEDGSEESHNFDGPQVLVPGELLAWLKTKLPKPDDRTGAKRRDRDESFFAMLREAVVNAIVHRDYSIAGAKIQVVVTPQSVTIRSPGKPVSPITIEQMQSLNAPMRSRNSTLHYIFNRMRLAEERGLGLKSMKSIAEAAGLPRPMFLWNEPYLDLTLHRSAAGVEAGLPADVRDQLNQPELRGYEWLATQDRVTSAAYAEAQGLEKRAGTLHLKKFVDLGIAEREGKGRATTYRAK